MDIEKRLIDAMGTVAKISKKVTPLIHTGASSVQVYNEVLQVIGEATTVDAVEVVHARWENGHCTNCTHYAEVQNIGFTCTGEIKINYKHTNYCPNCGAKMDGDV